MLDALLRLPSLFGILWCLKPDSNRALNLGGGEGTTGDNTCGKSTDVGPSFLAQLGEKIFAGPFRLFSKKLVGGIKNKNKFALHRIRRARERIFFKIPKTKQNESSGGENPKKYPPKKEGVYYYCPLALSPQKLGTEMRCRGKREGGGDREHCRFFFFFLLLLVGWMMRGDDRFCRLGRNSTDIYA